MPMSLVACCGEAPGEFRGHHRSRIVLGGCGRAVVAGGVAVRGIVAEEWVIFHRHHVPAGCTPYDCERARAPAMT